MLIAHQTQNNIMTENKLSEEINLWKWQSRVITIVFYFSFEIWVHFTVGDSGRGKAKWNKIANHLLSLFLTLHYLPLIFGPGSNALALPTRLLVKSSEFLPVPLHLLSHSWPPPAQTLLISQTPLPVDLWAGPAVPAFVPFPRLFALPGNPILPSFSSLTSH